MFVAAEGSISVVGAAGGTVTCPLTDGFGWADSATLRPQDVFAEVGITNYSGCSGPGPAGLQVISGWGTVLHDETYDAAADRISGSAYPWVWGMALEAPDCQVDLYPIDHDAGAPLTFDNRPAATQPHRGHRWSGETLDPRRRGQRLSDERDRVERVPGDRPAPA